MLRLVCVGFALSSFALAAWMLAEPEGFWRVIGVSGNPFAQALYGGAIAGEGFMFAQCARKPLRYLVFFEYMIVYKTLACLAGARVLLASHGAPPSAWLAIAGWAVAGAISGGIVATARRRSVTPR